MREEYYRYLAEIGASFTLILIGDTAIAADVFTGGNVTFSWVVMGGWTLAVALAVYIFGGISAHFNPAVSVAMAATGRMRKKDLIPYIICQVFGAFLGAAFTYLFYFGPWNIMDPNRTKMIPAFIFYCMYPHPGFWGDYYPTSIGGTGLKVADVDAVFPLWHMFALEVILTFMLLLVIVAITDPDSPINVVPHHGAIVGLYVGVACLIEAPLTMMCINPCRDFGPRLFALLLGYGPELTIPGPRGQWWIYWVAPIIGGLLGVYFWDKCLRPFFKKKR